MTFTQQLHWDLTEAGLPAEGVAWIVGALQADAAVAALDVRWDDHGIYPGTYRQLWRHAERVALEWIQAHAPEHPARKRLDRAAYHVGVRWERLGLDLVQVAGIPGHWGGPHSRRSLENYRAMIEQRYVQDRHAIEDGFAALDAPYEPGPEEPLIELPDWYYQQMRDDGR